METLEDYFNWDPFEQISNTRRTMNTLLDSIMRPGVGTTLGEFASPALDLYEKDGKYIVEAALPGLKKEDIEIEVADNRLAVSAKKLGEKREDNARYHYCEVRRGGFSRTITFPQEIDTDKVNAEYENGILRITLPSTKPIQAKRVSIKG